MLCFRTLFAAVLLDAVNAKVTAAALTFFAFAQLNAVHANFVLARHCLTNCGKQLQLPLPLLLLPRKDEGKTNAKSGKLHKKSRLESLGRGITTRVDGNGVSA